MAHDLQFERGESFGEWLHNEILESVVVEDAPWAVERIRRVEARLQAHRPESDRLKVEIPWWEEATAFTAPGQYIYFSRRLYEVCPTDEPVAFVVAHEIAHHDLGHVALFHGWTNKIIHLPGAACFALFFHGLERLVYNPQKECEADRHGLDLCIAAGYDGGRCLELFDILEERALCIGDLDIVYGPDVQSDDELDQNAGWKTKAQIWAWQKKRGYLPIRDRRQMLKKHLDASARGVQQSAPVDGGREHRFQSNALGPPPLS
jgi:predicted Zn-dependent protease